MNLFLNALNIDTLEMDYFMGSDAFVGEQENTVIDVHCAVTTTHDVHESEALATYRRSVTYITSDDVQSVTTFPTTNNTAPTTPRPNGYTVFGDNGSFGISISVALCIFRGYFKIRFILLIGKVERECIRDYRSSICLLHSV